MSVGPGSSPRGQVVSGEPHTDPEIVRNRWIAVTDLGPPEVSKGVTFDEFLDGGRARLVAGLVAAYGPEVGQDAAAEAMAYGWQHWDRLQKMDNPIGYLYRVGQSASRSTRRPAGFLPAEPLDGLPEFEPGLSPALEELSEQQRSCLILVHALGWSQAEAARLLDIDVSTLRTHIQRGLERLRVALKVEPHV